MKKVLLSGLAAAVLAGLAVPASAEHGLGLGANYWRTVDEIAANSDFDRSGVSYYLTYRYKTESWLFFDAQLERMPEGYMASTNAVYAPQLFLGLKISMIYGGVGAGMFYSDGDWKDDPFYVFRAGVDLNVLPMLYLDINANYRFTDWKELNRDDINKDTIMLGAAARLVF
jgi:hypothetical protein